MCKPNTRRASTLRAHTITRTDVPNVEPQPTWRDSGVQQKNTSAKLAISLDILQACLSRKKQANFKPRRPKAHQLQAGAVYVKGSVSYDHLDEESTSED